MLEKDLQNLGLSEKEARVYITSLKLGKSSVQNIAKESGVNRATTYVIIEGLIKKGLISSILEGKKQFFFAESPEKLNILFRDQELEIRKKQEYLEKILPDLKTLNTSINGKPAVRFFEGKEGARAIAEELYTDKNTDLIRAFYSYDLLLEMFPKEEIDNLRKRRVLKGMKKIKVITNDEQNRLETDAEVIRIKSKENPITSDIAIFGDKIRIIVQKGEFVGLIIDNKEMSNTLKTLFDLAWKGLKK
jgi:HTH-type transcriptional regulator, sugar sensing transcriptional regulator